MIGSQAERHLLGAVTLDPKQLRMVDGLVSGADFQDERLGRIFDGINAMSAEGSPIDQITVQNMWPEFGIIGIPSTDVFEWADASIHINASSEYARSVRDAAGRRGLNNTARWILDGAQNHSFPPMDVATRGVALLDEIRESRSSNDMVAKSLAEILEGSDSYDWIIPGLLERQDRVIITGAEGAGKTTWARQLVVLSAAGIHPTTFQRIDPVSVLVIDAENTERQWRRAVRWTSAEAKRWGTADPALSVHVVAGRRLDITQGSHLADIHRLVDLHKPDVLYIGPLYKLVAKAITNDDDASPLIVALDSLRERGLALIMEAHAGKAADSHGQRNLAPRGSAALMGWPEFGIGLQTTDDKNLVNVIKWRGDRDERDWPKAMYRGGDWPWTPTQRV